MAELAAITQLAQPRVSTHLSKLKDAGLVHDRRDGVFAYYRAARLVPGDLAGELWQNVRSSTKDPVFDADAKRLPEVLAARHDDESWVDAVAGDMERHYSPGRTWEAMARSVLTLLKPGRVLDIASGDGVLAELLAPQSEHYTCIDFSPKVVQAAEARLSHLDHVDVHQGDMHALPFDADQFDLVLMMHALTYAPKPDVALAEAARVLAPGGRLLAVTLASHKHQSVVKPFGHTNQGFTPKKLTSLAKKAGLTVDFCDLVAREKRPPHFEVLCLKGGK